MGDTCSEGGLDSITNMVEVGSNGRHSPTTGRFSLPISRSHRLIKYIECDVAAAAISAANWPDERAWTSAIHRDEDGYSRGASRSHYISAETVSSGRSPRCSTHTVLPTAPDSLGRGRGRDLHPKRECVNRWIISVFGPWLEHPRRNRLVERLRQRSKIVPNRLR
jgi:hypothetical protein